ncbi:hypothetical protein BC939DRAFT_505298 [Gamsiella multidivaricata]|uniref:uncharacterized protein n=1 Tax=Gamsiella multidivaricata TaxID=101098 RepID=UPI00221E6740|nr:uncharacterized protein BC939DRAFT_505298 [Gamsiella multidivaricata]KAI7820037.1 hypothetical protein BC939DRAFT_505298 [Gamsiella multidivaricata]
MTTILQGLITVILDLKAEQTDRLSERGRCVLHDDRSLELVCLARHTGPPHYYGCMRKSLTEAGSETWADPAAIQRAPARSSYRSKASVLRQYMMLKLALARRLIPPASLLGKVARVLELLQPIVASAGNIIKGRSEYRSDRRFYLNFRLSIESLSIVLVEMKSLSRTKAQNAEDHRELFDGLNLAIVSGL